MARKPLSARVIEERGQRFIETVYSGGETVRILVDPERRPVRRPRRPFARVVDYSSPKEVKACPEAATGEAKQRSEI